MPLHVVVFGPTGGGKSWLCNKLSKSTKFVECDGIEAGTTNIQCETMANGDKIVDVPGYNSPDGNDIKYLAAYVDYLREQTITTILFVVPSPGRADPFVQEALHAFTNSELKQNILVVVNKDPRRSEVSTYIHPQSRVEFPMVYVKMNQTDVTELKARIERTPSVEVKGLVNPVCLFPDINVVVKTENIKVFMGNEQREVKETVTTSRQETRYNTYEKWQGGLGKVLGKKKTVSEPYTVTLTDSQDVMVPRMFAIHHIYKLTYGRRFDNQIHVSKREHVETLSELIK